MARILIIDDDQDLLRMMERALIKDQHQVETNHQAELIEESQLLKAELVILDIMMPNMDGFEFLRKYRHKIDAPVIYLTARNLEQDKVHGFALGADDYIVKPFSILEFRSRIAAHLRREKRIKSSRLIDGNIFCDMLGKQFFVDEALIPLTASEYEICELLMLNQGQIFSKEDIYVQVYGYEGRGDSRSSITQRVKEIRQKFMLMNENPIKTVWGIGYKWERNL
ncbi:response regulator transcription factor [Facklamia lactis]|nr:response regulator transcription factor [Facklamia lactis]